MKGLKKVSLISAIAAVSAGAQAELKALDDAMMGELTGQAGLTIEIETKWSIGEFAYQDAGFVLLQGMKMGGHTDASGNQTLMDNLRLDLDVAGSGLRDGYNPDNLTNYGMSVAKFAARAIYVKESGATVDPVTTAVNESYGALTHTNPDSLDFYDAGFFGKINSGKYAGLYIDSKREHGDGDLVLHFGAADGFEKAGGFTALDNGAGAIIDASGNAASAGSTTFENITWDETVDVMSRAIDFEFSIDAIAIASSNYEVGSGNSVNASAVDFDASGNTDAQSTTLISDLTMKGYMGPMDIIIQNNGNGFDADGNADSKILWESYVKVTDLDLYIDIAGVQLSDVKIHNVRGDLTGLNTVMVDASGNATLDEAQSVDTKGTAAFGFAHSKREIYAVKDAIVDVAQNLFGLDGLKDGIAINTQFKGDIDIGGISFGQDGQSIGSIYLTDIESTTNWTISAH